MHQTTKYKFNLIETTDAFSPEKLNENAETAERELAAEAAARGAADTAIRAEFAAADKSLSQTVTANKSELQATITAVEKGANLVHLAGPYTGDGTSTVTIDLSKVDMNQYRALLFFTYAINKGSFSIGTSLNYQLQGAGGNVVWVYHLGEKAFFCSQYATTVVSGTSGHIESLNWSAINSITMYFGIYCDIYAIKA